MIIALPETLYVLRTKPGQDIVREEEEYNIYFKNIILPYREDYDVKIDCEFGANYGEFWRITEFPYDIDSFPLTVKVYDETGTKLSEKSCTVRMSDKVKSDEFCVMTFGDSMTHEAQYVSHMVHKLNNIKTRGLRTFDGLIRTEGRGGWSYQSYFENVTVCWGGVSPFLFPKGVDGAEYFGDIDFETLKKKEDRPTYSYDGLPIFEIENGMVYHKDGKLYRKENDGDILIDENPKWEFSFKKYMERFKVGKIDAISILMGANDLQNVTYENCDEYVDKYIKNTRKMIDSVWEYDSNIKIVLNLPVIGAGQYAWGKRRGCAAGSKTYRAGMIKAADRLINEFENKDGIYISAMLLNIDPEYGFDAEPYKVNKYSDHYVMKQKDWVHPNSVGYKQMGDALAAVIEAIR